MKEFAQEELISLACELPDEIEKYRQHGDFTAAEAAIERWLNRPVAGILKTRLRLEKQILQGLCENFPYTEEQVIGLFREYVSDFGEEDLSRLDQNGLAEWIFRDGEKHYIHNIVRNVTQKDPEIMRRAGLPDPETDEKILLKEEIRRMRQQKSTCWKFRLRTSIRLKDELFYPGIQLKAHLPIPAELYQTSDVRILDHSDVKVSVDRADSLYRSICFEDVPEKNRDYFVEYEYTVKARYHDFSREDYEAAVKEKNTRHVSHSSFMCCAQDNTADELAPYLEEQYPHIRFSPYLCALAEEITEGLESTLAKASAIYDYITKNVKYSYMREYFLLPDIPQYCARNLRGDCGVQALLFITLCRICGIPAKWQSGLYFGGRKEVGPHDWAMFYAEPYGWLYADPSLGGSAYCDGDEARRRFYFGNLDPFRMVANNAFAQTFANPKRFLPADPYDNQSGEMESETRGYGSRDVVTEKILVEASRILVQD